MYVELEKVAEFLSDKNFVSDREAAKKQISKSLKLKQRTGTMNLAHF